MSWFEPIELVIKLYNDGDNEGCVAQVESILNDSLPPCPRVRCHILLGHARDDWYEVEVRRVQSLEMIIDSLLRRQHPFEPRTTWHTGACTDRLPALLPELGGKGSRKRYAIFSMTWLKS